MTGRPNQKQRTRKDLLQAASRLVRKGLTPTLEAVAEEALVSRATAYRYFPSVDALLAEAAMDVATPEAEALFGGPDAPADPAGRLHRVDAAFHDMVLANEPAMRIMLARSVERVARGDDGGGLPLRQNRRLPLIEQALEPLRDAVPPAELDRLAKALSLIIGTEAMVALKDVLRVDDAEARAIKRWAIDALLRAAGPR